MRKINKAWVTTHTRADGKKFYTAHIRLISHIFWWIPVYYTYPLVEITTEPFQCWVSHTEWDGNAYKFPLKTQAEQHLMDVIDRYLDILQTKENAKIISRVDEPISGLA